MATIKIYDGTQWVELAKKSDIPSLTSYATKTYAKGLLTPAVVGQSQTTSGVNGYTGASFSIGKPRLGYTNGLYIFTYGYCMIMLPVYNCTPGEEYKVTATLLSSGGSYDTRVLTYRVTSNYDLQIYNKQNFIPTGYGCALFRISLY